MEETLRHHLLKCAALFEEATDITPATVGKRALNDNTYFARIATGQGFTIRTYDKVMEWLSDNWPDDKVEWPADIPRPSGPERPSPFQENVPASAVVEAA